MRIVRIWTAGLVLALAAGSVSADHLRSPLSTRHVCLSCGLSDRYLEQRQCQIRRERERLQTLRLERLQLEQAEEQARLDRLRRRHGG